MFEPNQGLTEEQNNEPKKEEPADGKQVGAEKIGAEQISEEKKVAEENVGAEQISHEQTGEAQSVNEKQVAEEQVGEQIINEQISAEKFAEQQDHQPNETQINQEQIAQTVEEQIAEEQVDEEQVDEEKFNAQNVEDLNQPLENSDDLLEEESSPEDVFSKKRLFIIIAIIFGVILISGGLLFAADRFFNLEIPFISKIFQKKSIENITGPTAAIESPEDVMQKMFSSFKTIRTSHEIFDLKITEDNKNGKDNILNILLEGKQDFNTAENPKLDYIFTFIQPNSNVDISFVFRYIDNIMHIKLAEGSNVPFWDLSELQNQWFYFGKQEREKLQKTIANVAQPASQLENKENAKENISEIFKEAKLFKTIQPLPDDVIDSIPVFHYLITLDTQRFFDFLIKSEEFGQNKIKDQNLQVEFPKEKINEIRQFLEKIKDAPVEVWIEKESYVLRKASVNHFEADIAKSDGMRKADVSFTFELNKINEPADMQIPEDGASLEQVIQNIFEKWFGQTALLDNAGNAPAAADKADDDQDGLTNQEELLYNTNPLNPDTDGDGYLDGDEVKHGYNPNGPGALN